MVITAFRNTLKQYSYSALLQLYVPIASISITVSIIIFKIKLSGTFTKPVLKALAESELAGAKKFPAASVTAELIRF